MGDSILSFRVYDFKGVRMLCVVKKCKKFYPKTLEELKEVCNQNIPLWQIEFPKNLRSINGLFYNSTRLLKDYRGIEDWDFSQVVDWTSAFENASNFTQELDCFNNAKYLDNSFKNAISFSDDFRKKRFPRVVSSEGTLENTGVKDQNKGIFASSSCPFLENFFNQKRGKDNE